MDDEALGVAELAIPRLEIHPGVMPGSGRGLVGARPWALRERAPGIGLQRLPGLGSRARRRGARLAATDVVMRPPGALELLERLLSRDRGELRVVIPALVLCATQANGKSVISGASELRVKESDRLKTITAELKKMGALGSKSGKTGGYFLIKKPEDIRLSDIVRHFEGAIALLYCVSEKQYQPCEFCKDEDTCKIRGVFKEIRDTTSGILEKTTLRDLI